MNTLIVEIADTPYSQEQGLMFRKTLNTNSGMLFKFSSPRTLKFWGFNTYMPLDIAFVDTNNKIVNIERIKPMSMRTVESKKTCAMAIEANEGYFDYHKIKEGDSISIHGKSIIFHKKEKTAQTIINKDKAPISPENKDLQQNDENLPIINKEDLDQYDVEESEPAEEIPEEPVAETPEEVEEPEPAEEVPEYPQFANQLDALKYAEENREVVRIKYITKRGINLVRDVEPHGDYFSVSTHRPILVTYDETVGGIKSFIMANIKEYSFLGKKFNKKFRVR